MAFSMKNIAILVGITNYEEASMQLPGCANDVAIMELVLRSGGNFEEIITIASTNAETLKGELANTVNRFSHEDVGDLLFYFTGHGDYIDEDFVYQLRDYDDCRVAQTSLSNTELDGLLRSLSPNVLIKIVDACNSGMPYIKGGSSVSNYLAEEMKGTFPKCYFFFSSQNDQESYAEQNISDFTCAFARAIATSQSDTVRYKHVIDHISDSFSTQRKQIPQFVAQAAFTEILGAYAPPAKQIITLRLGEKTEGKQSERSLSASTVSDLPGSSTHQTQPHKSLIEIARLSAQNYVSMDEAKQVVTKLKACLSSVNTESDLATLYTINLAFSDRYVDMPNEGAIGKWIQDNTAGGYFAEATFFTESYEAPRANAGLMIALAGPLGVFEKDTITKTRKVISGVATELTGFPFLTCTVTLHPNLPNLLEYKGWLTFLLSKTTIQVFYSFSQYKEVSWNEFELSFATNWIRRELPLVAPGDLQVVADEFQSSLFTWVAERTRSRVLPASEA
jgi:hypothetical protein